MDWLPLLKFVHVLAAITALGSNVTYVLWLRTSEPAHVAYAIRGVRRLDGTIANPAYGVLLVTGVLMVATGAFSYSEHWLQIAIALYVLTALLGFVVFAPAIRRQLAEAEADPSSAAYRAAAQRTTGLGLLTMAVVLVIVYLMVVKPF